MWDAGQRVMAAAREAQAACAFWRRGAWAPTVWLVGLRVMAATPEAPVRERALRVPAMKVTKRLRARRVVPGRVAHRAARDGRRP